MFIFRTIIILVVLILLLCIALKIKLNPDAYFNTVNFATLFLGYFIYGLQLIAFCIMNAQIFNANVRAIIFTFVIYYLSNTVSSWTNAWPAGIQYILMFFSPYIALRSLFQVRNLRAESLFINFLILYSKKYYMI